MMVEALKDETFAMPQRAAQFFEIITKKGMRPKAHQGRGDRTNPK